MPIHAAKYDKKKPSDLYNKALSIWIKISGKAQKFFVYRGRKRMMLMVGLFSLSSRKLGSYANAEKYYEKALEIDPDNKAALEYQGELFITTDRPEMAKVNLEKLKVLPRLYDELENSNFILNKSEKKI